MSDPIKKQIMDRIASNFPSLRHLHVHRIVCENEHAKCVRSEMASIRVCRSVSVRVEPRLKIIICDSQKRNPKTLFHSVKCHAHFNTGKCSLTVPCGIPGGARNLVKRHNCPSKNQSCCDNHQDSLHPSNNTSPDNPIRRRPLLGFGAWNFSGHWCLVIGHLRRTETKRMNPCPTA